MRIDVHNHAIPRAVVELLDSDPAYRVTVDGDQISGGNHVPFTLEPSFVDPNAKLQELESVGLEAAVVSAAPPIFYYELDEEHAETICRVTNSGLAGFTEAHPDRFRWMAHVPAAYPERAAAVLADAARDGAVGVEIGTRIEGRRLDEAEFEPLWSTAERHRLPVMLHPFYNEPHRGLDDYYLQNVIGNQLETTVAVERLICAGVLDRHPGLRILAVHGGGYFPYQAGRLRHARTVRPELASAPTDPWSYRGQIVVDTITHDVAALRYLVDRIGADHVVMGTDLPFDMAPPQPMSELIDAVDGERVRQIAEENPARLYRFEP